MDPAELAARGWTRETQIRRDAHGRWYEGGEPVEHPRIAEAFDSWIERAPDGRYCLKNSVHWVYVDIQGPPVFVRAVSMSGDEAHLRLSDGRVEALDPDTLRVGPDDALYCDVRGGDLPARFDRSASMQLADVIDEDDAGVFVKLAGRRVRPPTVSNPLESTRR